MAKETVYGTKARAVCKVDSRRRSHSPDSGEHPIHQVHSKESDFPKGTCPRCGKTDHKYVDCPFKEVVRRYCQKLGHLEAVCLKKQGQTQPIKTISKHNSNTDSQSDRGSSPTTTIIQIQGNQFVFEVDTGTGDNLCSNDVWCDLGKPARSPVTGRYEVPNGQPLPTLGTFMTVVSLQGGDSSQGKSVEIYCYQSSPTQQPSGSPCYSQA